MVVGYDPGHPFSLALSPPPPNCWDGAARPAGLLGHRLARHFMGSVSFSVNVKRHSHPGSFLEGRGFLTCAGHTPGRSPVPGPHWVSSGLGVLWHGCAFLLPRVAWAGTEHVLVLCRIVGSGGSPCAECRPQPHTLPSPWGTDFSLTLLLGVGGALGSPRRDRLWLSSHLCRSLVSSLFMCSDGTGREEVIRRSCSV